MSNFIILVCLLSVPAVISDSNTLRLVNLVYRHGDRSPISIYPTDINNITKWPQGLGWLTKIGMREHYELGQWLRQKYMTQENFLSPDYKHDEIQVISSDENRCLMSAYCNLAGLYPPRDNMKFSENITWQPIPVHTRPEVEDNSINMGEPCPRYRQLLLKSLTSPGIVEEEKRNKPFYDFVGKMSGWLSQNISNIWRVTDTVFCEKSHNMNWSSWVNETVYQKLRDLEAVQFTLMYNSTEKSRLMGGPLLKKMIESMQNKTASPFSAVKTKLFMYSGHDTTVAALMSALGVFNKMNPPYASMMVLELHQKPSGDFFVRMYFKNTTDSYVTLMLSNCAVDCPFDQFVKLTRPVIPVDWLAECGLSIGQTSTTKLDTAWIVVIVLASFLFFLLTAGCIYMFVRYRKKNEPFLYGKFDVDS